MATTSDSHSAPDDRSCVETFDRGRARTSGWRSPRRRSRRRSGRRCRATASRVLIVPNSRSTSVTAGLKWAPDTAPNIRIRPISAPAVAAAFSSSCRPTSSGDRRLAMIPEPITAMISRPVPSASATSRGPGRVRSVDRSAAGRLAVPAPLRSAHRLSAQRVHSSSVPHDIAVRRRARCRTPSRSRDP